MTVPYFKRTDCINCVDSITEGVFFSDTKSVLKSLSVINLTDYKINKESACL